MLHRNCFLKHVIEGKLEGRIEVTGRRERRRKKLLEALIALCRELVSEETMALS
jgi:hypothetical protein